jgi:hypothetical protein
LIKNNINTLVLNKYNLLKRSSYVYSTINVQKEYVVTGLFICKAAIIALFCNIFLDYLTGKLCQQEGNIVEYKYGRDF